MATARQIKANRKNARRCCGPRTPQGRAISSQNALKTGIYAQAEIIRTEDRENYEILISEFHARFTPATTKENRLVQDLIRAEWLGRRAMASAASVINRSFNAFHDSDECHDNDFGRVILERMDQICRSQRRIKVAIRDFARALRQLTALRAIKPRKKRRPTLSTQST
jgi:hypothetical protein